MFTRCRVSLRRLSPGLNAVKRCFCIIKDDDFLKISRLTDRSLIEISGSDSLPVLVNLTTSDVREIENRKGGQFTSFLNSKVKLMRLSSEVETDCFRGD